MQDSVHALLDRIGRDPRDQEAFAALRLHFGRVGDHASLINLLEAWAHAHADQPSVAAHAFFEAAEIAGHHLQDPRRALSLYQHAVEHDSGHPQAAQRLEQAYLAAQDYGALATMLERRLDGLPEGALDYQSLAREYFRLADLVEHKLGRPERALLSYRRAYELDPTLLHAVYASRMIYYRAGNFHAAVPLYEQEIRAEQDPARSLALFRELGALQKSKLEDYAAATATLEEAQRRFPSDNSIRKDLARLYLERAKRARSPDVIAESHDRATQLLLEMAKKASKPKAIGYLHSVLDVLPAHEGALEELEKLIGEGSRRKELPLRWVAFLKASPSSKRAYAIRHKLAQAYMEHRQTDDAILCLEPLVKHGDKRAIDLLAELYQRANRATDAIRTLKVSLRDASANERVAKLHRIIKLFLKTNDRDGALMAAFDVLAVDPGDPEALAFADEECRKRKNYKRLRDLLLAASRIPQLPLPARRHRLYEVASISQKFLNDSETAAAAWRSIYNLDPTDAEASERYIEILEHRGAKTELTNVLEREASSQPDTAMRLRALKKLAQLRIDEQEEREAIELLRQAHRLDAKDEEVIRLLSDLLIESGRGKEALPLLRKRLTHERGEAKRKLTHQVADTLLHNLKDYEEAYKLSVDLLDQYPGDMEALDRMQEIDTHLGRSQQLLTTLERRVDVAPDHAKAPILLHIASLQEAHQTDKDEALASYVLALKASDEPEVVAIPMKQAFNKAGKLDAYVAALLQRVDDETRSSQQVTLLRHAARTAHNELQAEEEASRAWRAILDHQEDEEALRALTHYAREAKDHEALQSHLGRLARLVDKEQERASLLLERAELLRFELRRLPDAAGVLFELIAHVGAANDVALDALCDLYDEDDDMPGLARGLHQLLGVTEVESSKVRVARRLAQLSSSRLLDEEKEEEALRIWAQTTTSDPEPWRMLSALYERQENWRALVEANRELLLREDEEQAQAAIALRTARIYSDRLDCFAEAWELLREWAERGHQAADRALRALSEQAGMGEQLAKLYDDMAEHASSTDEHIRYGLAAAEVRAELCHAPKDALEGLRSLATLATRDTTWLDSADDIAAKQNDWSTLVEIYNILLDNLPDAESQHGLLIRLAHRIDRAETNPELAFDVAQHAWKCAPDSPAALDLLDALSVKAHRVDQALQDYGARMKDAPTTRLNLLTRSALLCMAKDKSAEAKGLLRSAVQVAVERHELDELTSRVTRAHPEDELPQRVGLLADALMEEAHAQAPARSGAPTLLQRAAELLIQAERRDEGLEAMLEAARTASPDVAALESMISFARRHQAESFLDESLHALAKATLDRTFAVHALRERARVLEHDLDRLSDAADVYSKLIAIDPDDEDSFSHLFRLLRTSERFQDLLVAFHSALDLASTDARQIALLRQIARLWEDELAFPREAVASWEKIQELNPDDKEAGQRLAALHALERAS